MNKEQVLLNAANTLNRADQPWFVTVEGDSIIAAWKWMDATFFGIGEVTEEIRNYKFIVTLLDNGKWEEKDVLTSVEAGASIPEKKLKFSASAFSGHASEKSVKIGLGKNNQTGEIGVIKSKFDTKLVKEPVRNYLTGCGWKRKKLFG